MPPLPDVRKAQDPLTPIAAALAAGVAAAATGLPVGCALVPMFLLRAIRPATTLALLIGFVAGHSALAAAPSTSHTLALPAWYQVEGRVRAPPAQGRGAWRFTLDVDRIGRGQRTLHVRLPVRITLWNDDNRGGALPRLEPRTRVRCVVHLARRGGYLPSGRLPDGRALTVLGHAPTDPLSRLRGRAARTFDTWLEPRDAGLARALLLGDRTALDRRDRTVFRSAGQAHLLAVSGIHVGLLLAGVTWIVARLGASIRTTWLLGFLTALLYVPFTGAPPSAVRAGCAAAVYFAGRLLGRPPRSMGVLSLVAASILLIEPAALPRVSFQLSFAAVIAILTLAPRMYDALVPLPPAVPGVSRRRAPIRGALCVACAAWLGTAPLVAVHIGRLCPAGAVLSLPAIPLAAVTLGLGFSLLLLAPVPVLASAVATGFALSTETLRTLLAAATDIGLGTLPVAAPSPGWLCAYVVAFGLCVRAPRRIACAAGLGLCLLLAHLFVAPDREAVPMWDAAEYHARAAPMPEPVFPHALAEPGGLALLAGSLALFALVSMRLRWLTPAGATAAGLLGIATGWRFGWGGLAALFAPFVFASLLGKLPGPERADARNLQQVFCNGVPALLGIAIAVLGFPAHGLAFFLGALACLGSDTCATEVGVRWGGKPWRMFSKRPVKRGESGGVTNLGQLASAGGALLAPTAYAVTTGASFAYVGAIATAGVIGCLLDSVLGSLVQYRGVDPETGEVVEVHRFEGRRTKHHSGLGWMTNDAVNLISGLAAGAFAVAFAGLL